MTRRPLNPAEAAALLFEVVRRFTPKERPKTVRQFWPFIEALHAAQKLFREAVGIRRIRRLAACTSRRAGKSEAIAAMLLEICGNTPEVEAAYVAPTRGMAKRILWKILKRLSRDYSLGIEFNKSELTATLRNGSVIHLVGANNEEQVEKLRGIPLIMCVIDEAGTIGDHLEYLIEEVLRPTMIDYDGCVVLTGTPTEDCAGYFYEVTQPDVSKRRKGWEVHHWTVLDNPYVPSPAHVSDDIKARAKKYIGKVPNPNAAAWLEREREETGLSADHPADQREWQGLWVPSSDLLVYRDFNRKRNIALALPTKKIEWWWGLGIDLGHDDALGIVEWCHSPDYPIAFATRSWAKHLASVSTLTDHVKMVQEERGADRVSFCVLDIAGGPGKMIVEEINQRFGIGFAKPAEKANKPDFLKLLNTDLRRGRVKLIGTQQEIDGTAKKPHERGPCSTLLFEIPGLRWDRKKYARGRLVEDENCPNDVSDGFIYGYRECLQWAVDNEPDADFSEQIPEPPRGSRAATARDVAAHEERVEEALRTSKDREWFDPFE